MKERKRDYQTKTYLKYYLSRSESDSRDYKIHGSDKKYPYNPQSCHMCETSTTAKPEVVAQLANEMRALIQEIKTIIEAVIEKLSKDPNTRVATSLVRQAKPDRKSSKASHL